MNRRAQIYIGTCGWHYRHWRGPFYPSEMSAGDYLEYYCRHFDTVEINNSFYQLPDAPTLTRWQVSTPKGFTFAVKASRYITHMKKLKDSEQSVSTFLERVSSLKPKIGPVLFQLPPRWKVNAERFGGFLERLPRDRHFAFEFRDHTWFCKAIYDLLSGHNAALCIYDLAGFTSPRRVTCDFIYVRLHGPGKAYEGLYTTQTLAGWSGAFSSWAAQGKDVHCYFDNDQAGFEPRNAMRLKQMLRK